MKIQTFQKIRVTILTLSFILFPVTLNYLSPVVSMMGAMAGIVTGSVMVFCGQFVIAMFLGRSFCSWLCPGGALGDQVSQARKKRLPVRRVAWIKYAVWIPWLGMLLYFFRRAGGVQALRFGYGTQGGLSVTGAPALVAYTLVVLTFFLMSLIVGRRAGCHILCWMAPFMILGRKLGLALRMPSLRLVTRPESCVSCGRCTSACPMSLDVQTLVQAGRITDNNCILCGRCIDTCKRNTITWGWRS
ncbi:MAG: 4Fe-4S binding protein [Spirochaetales bacterium]|nr:4Fe-4S binding protein [Spirochaetales bacterium]